MITSRFRHRGQRLTAAGALCTLLVLLLLSSVPSAGAQGVPIRQATEGTVVGSGLVNPRFVAIADDGTLYVSEAGSGGTEEVPGTPIRRGMTGQVMRLGPGGAKTVVAASLPSYGATGPAGLVTAGGTLWLAIGGPIPGPEPLPLAPLPMENTVMRVISPTTAGQQGMQQVADIGAFEQANNPDAGVLGSNVFDLARAADGMLYVADSGGNVLFRVHPTTGQVSLVTVFARLPARQPGPGGQNEIEPVPTGVAVGPDGAVYVGLYGGGPPVTGRSKVVRVSPAGVVSEVVTGLSNIIDVEVGPDRHLYVVELSAGIDLSAQPPVVQPGRVLRVLPNGSTQVVVDGLEFPGGMTFDRQGTLFITTNTVTPPGPPPAPGTAPRGQVLRFDRIVAPAVALPRTGSAESGTTGGAPVAGLLPAGVGLLALVGTGTVAILTSRRRSA
ncbi:MAG TPA: ScyD/ScyE family protein [Chloroflexota bacterium]|nr:ScyD/ScyE family protein [Chloroflexota bacterium]